MKYEYAKEIIDKVKQIPYQKVGYIQKNANYANLLYQNMSGNLGELSAITQYIYEHMNYLEQVEFSKIMLMIAMVEMHHLDVIGELIKRLGKEPYFIGSNHQFWKADVLKYQFTTMKEIIQYNIYTENKAIEGYEFAIRNTKNMQIRRLLNRIILDEEAHIKIFQYMLETLE